MKENNLRDIIKGVKPTTKQTAFDLLKKGLIMKGYTVSDTYLIKKGSSNEMKIDITNSDNVKITQDVNGLSQIFGTISWFETADTAEALTHLVMMIEDYFKHKP